MKPGASRGGVSTDLIQRVLTRIAHTPDPRPERVADALSALSCGMPTSLQVAERIVWRAIADASR